MSIFSEVKKVFTKPVFIFLLVAFLPAWLLFLLPLFLGAPGTNGYQTTSLISWSLAMWMPGIAAIFSTRFVEKKRFSSSRKIEVSWFHVKHIP